MVGSRFTVRQGSERALACDLDNATVCLHDLDRTTTARVAVVDGGLVIRIPVAGHRVAVAGIVCCIQALVGRRSGWPRH